MFINKSIGRISSFSLVISALILITSCANDSTASNQYIEPMIIQLPEEVKFLSDGRTFSTRCAGYDRLGGRNQGVIEAQAWAKKEAVAANLSHVRSRFEDLTRCHKENMTMECNKNLETLTQVVSDGFIRKAEKKIVDYPDNIVCVSLTGLVSVPEVVPFTKSNLILADKDSVSSSKRETQKKVNHAKKEKIQDENIKFTQSEQLLIEGSLKEKKDKVKNETNISSINIDALKSRVVNDEELDKEDSRATLPDNINDSFNTINSTRNRIEDITSSTKNTNLLINGDFKRHFSNGWKVLEGKQKGIKRADTTKNGLRLSYKGKGSQDSQWALIQEINIDVTKPFAFESAFSTPNGVDVFPAVKLQFIDNDHRIVIENVWTADKYYESKSKFSKKIINKGFYQKIKLDSETFLNNLLSLRDKNRINHVRLIFDVSAPDGERCRLCEFNIKESKIKYL